MLMGETNRRAQPLAIAFLLLGSAATLGFVLWLMDAGWSWESLPPLLLLACPLMHLFIHRHHRPAVNVQAARRPAASSMRGTLCLASGC